MRSIGIDIHIIIMQYNNKFAYPKWNFYLASSKHSTYFFHFIIKRFKEILCCTKEHLSLLKYLKMIVFLRGKYITCLISCIILLSHQW